MSDRLSVRSFISLDARPKYAGLELEDWGVMVAVMIIVMAATKQLVLWFICFGALWCALRRLKASKPRGYVCAVLEYARSPKILDVELEVAPHA